MKYFFNFLIGLTIAFSSSVFSDELDSKTMLVMDASGSMWGQIDGKTKVEIARDVVNSTVNSWDPDQSLGLIAYGHNRKSDCSDIEVLIEPTQVNPAEFSAIASKLSPKGMTPLSAAVKMAAESLRFTEQAATVVLISDGKETCSLDPCAVGKSLEQAGVDFTAHIIGFDVAKEDSIGLRCLAEETGGTYLDASNAGELEQALQDTRVAVTDKIEPKRSPASVSVPIEVFAGSEFEVSWSGPENASDYLIVRSEDGVSNSGSIYVASQSVSSPSLMRAPNEAGAYLVHYELKDKSSLASAELTVITPNAAVDAPESVVAGAEFEVAWDGPKNEFDSLRIFNLEGEAMHEFSMLSNSDFNSPVNLNAPIHIGTYEVHYETMSGHVLAKDTFAVTDAVATVFVAENEVDAGAPIAVEWTGPQNQYDRLYIYEKSGERLNLYAFVERETSPLEMTAPEDAGEYLVAYTANGEAILAQTDLSVLPVTAMVSGPSSVKAGAEYEVTWFGPNHKKDAIYTFSAEGKDARSYKFLGDDDSPSQFTLVAPKEPGTYELRYLTPRKKILATHSLIVQ